MLFTNNRAGKAVLATAFAGALVFSGMGAGVADATDVVLPNGLILKKALSGVETDYSYKVDIKGKTVSGGTIEYKDMAKNNKVRVAQRQRLNLTYTFHDDFGPAAKGKEGDPGANIKDQVLGGFALNLDFLKQNAKDFHYSIDFSCGSTFLGASCLEQEYKDYSDAAYTAKIGYLKDHLSGSNLDNVSNVIDFVLTDPLEAEPGTQKNGADAVTADTGVYIDRGFVINVAIDYTPTQAAVGQITSTLGLCLDKAHYKTAGGADPDGKCDKDPNSKTDPKADELSMGNHLVIPMHFLGPIVSGDKYGPVCRPGTEMFDAVNHEEELALWVKDTGDLKVKVGNFKFFDDKGYAHKDLQGALKAMTDHGYVTKDVEVVEMKMEYTSVKDGVKASDTFRIGLRDAASEKCKKPKEPVIPAPVHTTIIQKIEVPKDKQQKGQKTIQGG